MIIVVCLVLFALIGLAVGLFKGFGAAKTWANELWLTYLLAFVFGAILKNVKGSPAIPGTVMLILTAVFILLLIGLSGLIKKALDKAMKKRIEEGNPSKGLNAVNRLLGGGTLALKGFTIALIFSLAVLAAIDIISYQPIKDSVSDIYAGPMWPILRTLTVDLFVIGIMYMGIKSGFASGIVSSLWSLIVLGMVIGIGFAAYNLAFHVAAFDSAAAGIENTISGWLSGMSSILESIKITTLDIARWILTAGLFLVMLVVVIIIAVLVPKFINFARFGNSFYIADGIFGAIVSWLILVGILLVLASIIQPLSDQPFMSSLNAYFENSFVAVFFYGKNILLAYGMPTIIPLRDWLVPSAA